MTGRANLSAEKRPFWCRIGFHAWSWRGIGLAAHGRCTRCRKVKRVPV